MTEKDNILQAWIMTEHLSEGNINKYDKSNLIFENVSNEDYYSWIKDILKKNKINEKKNGGFIIYFDIFSFSMTIDILREMFDIGPTFEDISIGDKFAFALYFDKDLKLIDNPLFYTVSAYIKNKKELPEEKKFSDFESDFSNKVTRLFDGEEEYSVIFNTALKRLLDENNILIGNCRISMIYNIEIDSVNLHSFFIKDLQKAKSINTLNLYAYLFGNQNDRVNLDSNKDSDNFNPDIFLKILKPDNYPLGRFPGNTKFALSFMQQTAVNLACGYDSSTIRSVNGPPGTGKTTLLKDIFAELSVKQAYDICMLSGKKIQSSETDIPAELPAGIAENNIVVASSNNGAVQNIVNEIPLLSAADEKLKQAVIDADYFYELSNTEVKEKWNKEKEKYDIITEQFSEDKYWGLYSLEGGKKGNIRNILNYIDQITKYLDDEYIEQTDIYNEFISKYNEVKKIRSSAQKYSEQNEKLIMLRSELKKAENMYLADKASAEKICSDDNRKFAQQVQEYNDKIQANKDLLADLRKKMSVCRDENNRLASELKTLEGSMPGFFAGKKKKEEHILKIEECKNKLKIVSDEYSVMSEKERSLVNEIDSDVRTINECSEREQNNITKMNQDIMSAKKRIEEIQKHIKECESSSADNRFQMIDMTKSYDELQISNPWFDEDYRIAQSELFIASLKVRKQFLYENRNSLIRAVKVWRFQEYYSEKRFAISNAWNWINLTIPVISSTFASFSQMCQFLGPETIGHLFIDEAGQALPQAAVGAIFRSRHVMVVGDPSQIKPVLTLDSAIMGMLGKKYDVSEKYLFDSASAQTLTDAASRYGFYREKDCNDSSWIGIPLWVHRRCLYPMFDISNRISYNGLMVQGNKKNGKTGWYDIGGKAVNKYVKEQGDFLSYKISRMMEKDPEIKDKTAKDKIYVITPFANVADKLANKLKEIGFTRKDENGKNVNVGTVHTFQGKEAPVVFLVLGADQSSKGSAGWAVSEPNIMNVAATRAKEEFYIIADRELYRNLGSDVISETYGVMRQYGNKYPELIDDDISGFMAEKNKNSSDTDGAGNFNSAKKWETEKPSYRFSGKKRSDSDRISGRIISVKKGKETKYAYIKGEDDKIYLVTEKMFSKIHNADTIIIEKNIITFVPSSFKNKLYALKISKED